MKKTYVKMLLRSVRESKARFFAILGIVAVGVGFLGGLVATTPDMQLTADRYYDENNVFDLNVRGTLGLTDDDIAALRAVPGVAHVMPARVTDVSLEGSGGSFVTRIYGVPLEEHASGKLLNDFVLLSGRMPEREGECLLASINGYTGEHEPGESLTISPDNKDYDKWSDTYAASTFTVVGTVRAPMYLSMEAEPSTVGNGQVELVLFAPAESYNLEAYTDAFVTLDGAAALNTFGDPYFELIDAQSDALETLGKTRAALRLDEVKAEAQQKIDDARAELDEKKAEAESKLADARAELDQGRTDLEAGKRTLEKSKRDLQTAKTKLANGARDLAIGKQTLESEAQKLADGWAALDEAKKAYTDGMNQLATQRAEYDASASSYDTAVNDFENGIAAQRAELERNRPYLTDAQYHAALAQIAQAEQQGAQQLEQNRLALDSAKAQLDAAQAQFDDAKRQIDANEQQLTAGDTALEKGRSDLAAAEAEVRSGERKVKNGEASIQKAERDLADAERKLQEGETEYADAKREADTKIAAGEQKLTDAQRALDDLGKAEWYVTDRRDTVSFTSYQDNSEKVAAIAAVFPLFFFAVAALVALTTMTRMVEEERPRIGTLKALGYTNRAITGYYAGYSLAAGLAGAAIGIVLGFRGLPAVIANAYSMMFVLPPVLTPFHWNYALLIVPAMLLCTTASTLFVCTGLLRERPAQLMQPRAPKAGKRIMLERVGFIWKRLKFTHKVTARNILRYKKRFFMTVFGVAGCCALLLAGFGLRDSIGDIVPKQFGEIFRYDFSVYLKQDGDAETDRRIRDVLTDPALVRGYAVVHSESAYVEYKGDRGKVTLTVPQDKDALLQQLTLRERRTGSSIPFKEDSLVLTEKLCETLGIRMGDTVTLVSADGVRTSRTVTGICENYVHSNAFLTASSYTQLFGTQPEYRLVYAQFAAENSDAKNAVSSRVLQSPNVLMLQFSQNIRDSFDRMLTNINYIVMVLILSAGALAIIVLYNLTNINICERKKELATIRVLGFHDREVAAYVYREITILSLVGILAGFVLGIALHTFVIRVAEIDSVMFGRTIKGMSYLYAAGVTLFFTLLVDLVMLPKLRAIDMVESMKAGE